MDTILMCYAIAHDNTLTPTPNATRLKNFISQYPEKLLI